MNFDSVSGEMLKGSLTSYGTETIVGYEDAMTQFDAQTNRWAATEGNSGYSWVCGFGNGYFGYGNRSGSVRVRPVVAFPFVL